MGEASQERLFLYLRNAEALLFPIRPKMNSLNVCPLVVMESLACGTPVIGSRVAPLEELPGWKKIAFLSEDITALKKAVLAAEKFDRKKCREFAEKHFDRSIMADKYINLYKKILTKDPGWIKK
jgi:glycosyltransferase involved in cell wall biosynthesis